MANPKIKLDITDSDCQELQEGKVFHWTFPDSTGRQVDLEVFNPDQTNERGYPDHAS